MKKKEEIEILEEYEIVEEEKKSTPIYIGYTPRLVISIILLPIFSMIAVFLLYKAFQVKDIINVRYSERSTPTFQVFGEDSNTLSPAEDGRWNQTDINKVLLETSYDFQTNTETTMNFTYQMMADLIILEKDNPDKVFFQKNIEVSEPKKEVMEGKAIIIKDQASIDYQEYNDTQLVNPIFFTGDPWSIVIRGGGWNDSSIFARVSSRIPRYSQWQDGVIGFRLVLSNVHNDYW